MTISAHFSANENASAILAGCGFSMGQKPTPTRTNENAVIDIRPVTASIISLTKKADAFNQHIGLLIFTIHNHEDLVDDYTPLEQTSHQS